MIAEIQTVTQIVATALSVIKLAETARGFLNSSAESDTVAVVQQAGAVVQQAGRFLNSFGGSDENIKCALKTRLTSIESKLDDLILRDLRAAILALDDFTSLKTLDAHKLRTAEDLFRKNTGLSISASTGGIQNSRIVAMSYLGLIHVELLESCNAELIARYILHMFATGDDLATVCFPKIQEDLVAGDAVYASLAEEHGKVEHYKDHRNCYHFHNNLYGSPRLDVYIIDLISAERKHRFMKRFYREVTKPAVASSPAASWR